MTETIDSQLLLVGYTSEVARRAGRSLTKQERTLILEGRLEALKAGYSRDAIEALIDEGRQLEIGSKF